MKDKNVFFDYKEFAKPLNRVGRKRKIFTAEHKLGYVTNMPLK